GEAGVSLDLNVVAKQLDIARSEIQPSLGATVYDFSRQAIETQPQGDNQPFNRLLLQAPGVSQDSFGQLHVPRRNEPITSMSAPLKSFCPGSKPGSVPTTRSPATCSTKGSSVRRSSSPRSTTRKDGSKASS